MEIIGNPQDINLETPQTFCHFTPDEVDARRYVGEHLPKTLVCHDFANGYHDDRLVDGTGEHDAYTFYNWATIDIFCYFSHHFITIPPLGWINVGHAHGVKVIGTVITEWAEGVEFWDKMLQDPESWHGFADSLVSIAKILNFDGWLLNIENKVSQPMELLSFVRYLHRSLHASLPHATLIWYDSVTNEGNLSWQNGLNHKNREFFDATDGFFTNYSWSETDVINTAAEAGDRLTDVYIGMDVWGRNFYGGGQFNLQEAVKIAYRHGLSIALFAPAWTYEGLHEEKEKLQLPHELDRYRHFLLRDRALWSSIWPYLYTKLPKIMPFQTSFCRGQGRKRRLYGEAICPGPWYNLRHMQYQPNSSHGPHGYILSTVDHIKDVSRQGLLKDPNGIIRYRLSHITEASLSQPVPVVDTEDEPEVTVGTDEEATEDQEKKHEKKKMKKFFKYIFRHKPPKPSSTENSQNIEEVQTAASTGQSMVHLAINLHLRRPKQRYALAPVFNEYECLEYCMSDSFIGGGCLKIHPSDAVNIDHRMSRIFYCDFVCEYMLVACVVTKTTRHVVGQSLNVILHVNDSKGSHSKVVLVGRDIAEASSHSKAKSHLIYTYPLRSDKDDSFKSLEKYLLLNVPGFYIPMDNLYNWKVSYYQVYLPRTCVTSVNCKTALVDGSIMLGHIGLCERKPE